MIALLVAVIIILALAIWAGATYNGLVGRRNRAEEALGSLDAHLRQRHDLVPNLVETVKGYASHEEETLARVVNARNATLTGSQADRTRAEDELGRSLKSLFALSESYPDLKANASFVDLQQKLTKLEEDILNARKYYNAIARSMNDAVEMFPSSIIASIFHFQRLSYLEIAEDERAVPEVRF